MLERLNELLNDKTLKVHGVFYDNSFFSQRYLCRTYAMVDNLNIEENTIKFTIASRVETVGIMELGETLELLIEHGAGDIPGLMDEGEQQVIPEPVSVTQFLHSLDIYLIFKDPKVTYQDITIAGNKFTVVDLEYTIAAEEDFSFEQKVTLMFGAADKLYLFSHFYNQVLEGEDLEKVLDLIIDKNVTGKAITHVRLETPSGATSGIYPYDKLISVYKSSDGDYIFGSGSGYIRIPEGKLQNYKLQFVPNQLSGSYRLDLTGEQETIKLFTE
jgi:hypothetical protein